MDKLGQFRPPTVATEYLLGDAAQECFLLKLNQQILLSTHCISEVDLQVRELRNEFNKWPKIKELEEDEAGV